nr:uncharacterized protein LOC124813276 [Hydra vulgaris]
MSIPKSYVFGLVVIFFTSTDLFCSFLPYYSCGISQINANFKTKVCTGLLGNSINVKIKDKGKLSSNLYDINDKATSEQVVGSKITPLEEIIFTIFTILLYICLFIINYIHCIKEKSYGLQYGKLIILTCIFALSLAKYLVGAKRIDVIYDINEEVYYGDTFYGYTAHLCNIFIVLLYQGFYFLSVLCFTQTIKSDQATQTEFYDIC